MKFSRLLSVFMLLLLPALAWAEAKPTVEARLNFDALHPGQQAAIAVIVDIPQGLHSQSATPSSKDFVAFKVTPADSAQATFLEPQYPKGHKVTYPSLGQLDVYDGRVIAYLPLEVKSDAPAGEIVFSGKLQIQLCDDQACFRPFRGKSAIPFSVTTQIVPTSQTISPANGDYFSGFDPRVFARQSTQSSQIPAPAGAEIRLLGQVFQLQHGAYALALGLALVVGIIFNLMPCVLPVVPLKAIGFYEASQHSRGRCLMLGAVFSFGLMAVFSILAVLVIVGNAAWGELFSKGWFVWGIVTVLVVMAAGQFGAFSVMLPRRVYNFVPSHSSWVGNFLFGGFTAILSTPCTAPMFLGILVWATGQPRWLGVATVQVVGFGMALPYLVLAAFPQLARKMPRTGPWAELVKQFMAFLLLAVAAYFAAGRLISGNSFLWIVTAIVIVGAIFLVVRTWMIAPSPRAIAISALIGAILAGGTTWFALRLGGSHELIAWEIYSSETLEKALAGDNIVMLEFTANWCANCKELESRVFTDPKVAEAIKQHKVTPIRADITLDDAPGYERLRQITSSGGIPLTVIYSPRLSRPIQLDSVYRSENLIAAFEQAATGSGEAARAARLNQ